MKYLILIFILTSTVGCKSKIEKENVVTEKSTELKPPFNNQGEQEDYWAQEFFKIEYKKQTHKRFTESIEIQKEKELLDGNGNRMEFANQIRFGNRAINIHLPDLKYQSIFKNGILYPDLISENDFTIGVFEELDFLSLTANVKRFRMWIFHEKRANP